MFFCTVCGSRLRAINCPTCDAAPTPIKEGRATVRIAPLTNAELVWGDDDAHDDIGQRDVMRWDRERLR